MASSVLNSLPLVFVVAGIALLAAAFHLSRRAQQHQRRMEALLALSGREIEPLDLPAAAWPQLESGGWRQLSWEGSWFGQPIRGICGQPRPGAPKAPALRCELGNGEDIMLVLSLTHSQSGGETRLFAEQLARVFVLLFETRLRSRTEALAAALAERARLSLYLQHDMRNLAQWVSWVSADFIACQDEANLLTTARRLKENAPLAWNKAERLIAALGKQATTDEPHLVDLRPTILKAAKMAGIAPIIAGDAQAWVAESLLARALDNLLSNLVVAWRERVADMPSLQLSSEDGWSEVRFFFPWPAGSVPLATEKLFEPFASGRPGGLGLGLYQARKSLREAGGELHAESSDAGLRFHLKLPAKAP